MNNCRNIEAPGHRAVDHHAPALDDVNLMETLHVDGHDGVGDDDDGDDDDQGNANDDDLMSSVVDSNDVALAKLISYFQPMKPIHFQSFVVMLWHYDCDDCSYLPCDVD